MLIACLIVLYFIGIYISINGQQRGVMPLDCMKNALLWPYKLVQKLINYLKSLA